MPTSAEVHHLHHWNLESAHQVSDGRIEYQCCRCGRRRVVHRTYGPTATIRSG